MRPWWSGWGGISIMSGSVREGAASAAGASLAHIIMISMLFSALMAPWIWG